LCWQTVEQQSIPALAIASAVIAQLKETHTEGQNSEDLTDKKDFCRNNFTIQYVNMLTRFFKLFY
jgi:hypothetical protein